MFEMLLSPSRCDMVGVEVELSLSLCLSLLQSLSCVTLEMSDMGVCPAVQGLNFQSPLT